ncbi:MAG: cellobiose phosphorylase [Clostridia bacterium]|nr:cellobiose phosphorylase [Clostridia bacterium]
MQDFELRGDTFIIRDYARKAPFSSFLPGLTGVTGIPMWSFYTNRGQGMCGFGIHHKGNAMMEFNPANTGYENTQVRGFRTFMRIDGEYYEPFFRADEDAVREMEIEKNVLTVREEKNGIRQTVTYWILPNENIGAVVRHVTLENRTGRRIALEMLDGMPQVIPFGLQNGAYKELSNLLKSWTDVGNIENGAPIYKQRATGEDTAEMKEVTGGWYFACVMDGELLPAVYDRDIIFGYDRSMMDPLRFRKNGLGSVMETPQVFANKVPCAFAAVTRDVEDGESLSFTAYMGYTQTQELLNRKIRDFRAPGYAEKKLAEARAAAEKLTADVETHTADKLLDAYVQQCYLDNFLRGGYPFVSGSGEKQRTLHLFSRKHGDPERDYNFFSIAGEYFSQGNGNYRDVCQNRRMDCSLHPEIGDYDIVNFYSLAQIDGYNPLEIRPSTFLLDPAYEEQADTVLSRYMDSGMEIVRKILHKPFTPGQITNALAAENLALKGTPEEFVGELLPLCAQRFEAGFGEGYWSDHWDYDLDLVEDYLSVWPEKKNELLFGKAACTWYDSPVAVRPRSETYVIQKGHVRQYGALRTSEVKAARPGFDPGGTNWMRDADGRIVYSTVFEKMLTLAVNKFALLDSQRLGVEMDGGKPGWNDAMNGLPGMIGSSMPETLELRRLVRFLLEAVRAKDPEKTVSMLEEPVAFMRDIRSAYMENSCMYACWDKVACLREAFRDRTEGGVTGKREDVTFAELADVLALMHDTLEDGVKRALEIGGGIMPTFLTYEASEYEPRMNADGTPYITPYGMPGAIVKNLERKDLPPFLEGPARYLASCGSEDIGTAREMVQKIRESELYDRKLEMYKTSAPIGECGMEIGRVRVFTPGWLERESVFLHMEYKYLLGMMKAGLYDEFYKTAETALIPHLDPAVYGRSILENSSFIASSVNPDPDTHGRGYVGRLSGSTAEMLSLWKMMFVGKGGFVEKDGKACFRFAPLLRADLFDENGEAAFTLCGSCCVVYHNKTGRNTYGEGKAAVQKIEVSGKSFAGDLLPAAESAAIRTHGIKRIDVYLS